MSGMIADLLGRAQQALFEAVVQPLVFAAGQGALLEDAYDATGRLISLDVSFYVASGGWTLGWPSLRVGAAAQCVAGSS